MIKKCIGCGSILQNEDSSVMGYVKELKYDFCERCFRTTNYNESTAKELNYTNNDIIKEISKNAKLCIFVVDSLTYDKEMLDIFKQIKTKKVLVINKWDLMPKSIKEEKIINYLEDQYQITDKVIILSSLKKKNIATLNNIIKNYDEIYFAGFTNMGKSSIIKAILKEYDNNDIKITTSIMPNTTADYIKIKYMDKTITDCPGFNYKNESINNDLKIVKKANTKNKIKPITLQIKENDIITIDDNWYIEFDKKNSATFYLSNNFIIKKVYDIKYESNLINVKSNTDIILKGIGFINVKNACTLNISFPCELIEKRNSIFE